MCVRACVRACVRVCEHHVETLRLCYVHDMYVNYNIISASLFSNSLLQSLLDVD